MRGAVIAVGFRKLRDFEFGASFFETLDVVRDQMKYGPSESKG